MTELLQRASSPRRILAFASVLGVIFLFIPARTLRSDNFVFYFPNSHQVLPLELIEKAKYLPLLQVLNLVGKVTGFQEKKDTLKVWFGKTPIELREDDKRVRMNKLALDLEHPVRISNGQWVVPLDFLTTVLPRLARVPIEYQVGTNRIFIGDVKQNSFTVRLDQVANGARLTVQFTDKVTVRTASQNGQWVMYLGERPVEPLEQAFHFQNPYVSELRFDDQDGVAKLILTPSASGFNFYPVLAEEGKVLLADVLKPPPVVAEQPRAPTETTTTAPNPSEASEEVPATQPGPPLPVVVLDAGHGGDDAGARSRDGIVEKDLVAQVVAQVRLALLSTKKFRIVLTRVGDSNLTFEQREIAANLARPAAFLTFHAGNIGPSAPRVMIYTYQASSPPPSAAHDEPRQLFVPWARVQELHLDRSRELAQALHEQFAGLAGVIVTAPLSAPARTLRSVGAPAVAVELGSVSPETDAAPLASPDFQQQISDAVARALRDFAGRQS